MTSQEVILWTFREDIGGNGNAVRQAWTNKLIAH